MEFDPIQCNALVLVNNAADSIEGADRDLEVLICTHNRARLLQRALASLNAAERPVGCTIGLFVVANACTDRTVQVLAEYQQVAPENGWLPLRWLEEPTPGKSHALNRSVPLVQAPVLAFVDDDHRVDRCYLVGVWEATRRYPEASLFCGRILPDWDGNEPAWVHERGAYRIYPLPVPNFDLGNRPLEVTRDIAVPGGGNLFIRTAVLSRVGGYQVNLGPVGHNLGGAEDIDWVIRALALGERLQYIPEVKQYHYVDTQRLRLSYLVRKAYKRSASMVPYSRGRKVKGVPPYMFRKVAKYLLYSLISLRPAARRFYLVRLAASLGEFKGFLAAGRLAKEEKPFLHKKS